jgi:hypothetical protein
MSSLKQTSSSWTNKAPPTLNSSRTPAILQGREKLANSSLYEHRFLLPSIKCTRGVCKTNGCRHSLALPFALLEARHPTNEILRVFVASKTTYEGCSAASVSAQAAARSTFRSTRQAPSADKRTPAPTPTAKPFPGVDRRLSRPAPGCPSLSAAAAPQCSARIGLKWWCGLGNRP